MTSLLIQEEVARGTKDPVEIEKLLRLISIYKKEHKLDPYVLSLIEVEARSWLEDLNTQG